MLGTPHKCGERAAHISYNITALGPIQRLTPGRGGCGRNVDGPGHTLPNGEWPRRGIPEFRPHPGPASELASHRFQGPTPRDSNPSCLRGGGPSWKLPRVIVRYSQVWAPGVAPLGILSSTLDPMWTHHTRISLLLQKIPVPLG